MKVLAFDFENRAIAHVESQDTLDHYFIDDSPLNIRGSLSYGWKNSVLFLEGDRA